MKHTHRIYTKLGFLLAAISVILGAFGSHFLKGLLSEQDLNTFDIGVRYQMMHAMAIIIISLSHRKFDESKLDNILGLFIIGIVIFSGSLYLLSTRSLLGIESIKFIGAITPVGGIAFIFAWLFLFFKGFGPEKDSVGSGISGSENSDRHRHRKSKHNKKGEDSQADS